MTDDELIELGLYCEDLLSQEHFNVLARQFDLQCFEHMMGTEAHETKKRESIFATRTGLRDFLGHLRAVVDQKDEILKRYEAPSDEDAPIEGID